LFFDVDEFSIQHVHPLPPNELIKVDSAGFGFVLMHKSIIPKMREKFPNQSMFAEQENVGDKYVGEDIVFFRKMQKWPAIEVTAIRSMPQRRPGSARVSTAPERTWRLMPAIRLVGPPSTSGGTNHGLKKDLITPCAIDPIRVATLSTEE
jgi:hypothetical protein